MTNVNIVFDDSFDDGDIICIPDDIVSHIQEIGQKFLDWVPFAKDSDYLVMEDGRKVCIAETDGFIKWLNDSYCRNSEKAYVVSRNTRYCKQYTVIEF